VRVMVRTVWVGLIFLIAICGLVAFKIGTATSSKSVASIDIPAEPADEETAPSVKADRLDVNYQDVVPDKTSVQTIPIVIPAPAPKAQPEKVAKIIGRHWHEGYAKITRRTIQRQREVSRSRHQS
jgi:hypothetical protein